MPEPLLIGSGNQGKVREIADLLEGMPFLVKGLSDFPRVPEPIEDGDTFEANAIKKAVYFSRKFGVRCLSDDSGLLVDALDPLSWILRGGD